MARCYAAIWMTSTAEEPAAKGDGDIGAVTDGFLIEL
jgi:hypothetical protein